MLVDVALLLWLGVCDNTACQRTRYLTDEDVLALWGLNDDVCTLVETTATRDYTYHELTCRAGEDIVLLNGELVCVSKNRYDAIIDGMKLVPEIEDKETCVVFCGDEVDEEQIDELTERVEEEFPLLDVEFIEGGQKHYRWIIGLC